MNRIGNRKLDTYDSIISLLLGNKEIVSTVKAFSYSTSKLCKVIDVIKKQEQTLRSEHFRKVLRASKSRDDLIICLIPFASALFLYGKKTRNKWLIEKYSKITQSRLLTFNSNELLNIAVSIYIASEKNLTRLKEFSIFNKNLQYLRMKIGDFNCTLGYHLESDCFSSFDGCSLEGLFLQADKILDNMDNYVDNLSKCYSGFYNEYVSVRNIYQTGRRKSYFKYSV